VSDDPTYRLPRTSDLVMSAVNAQILPWGIKAVWIRMLPLDGGPEGTYISDASLAEGLGLDAGTARNYRYELRRLGLARSFPRPGAKQYGWVLILPEVARPREGEPRGMVRRRAPALARILEVWLLTCHPELAPHLQSPDNTSPNGRSASSLSSRKDPAVVVQSEAQLPPAVTSNEEGVVAKATGTTRRENGRRSEQSEQLGMTAFELRVEPGTPRTNDPRIRSAIDKLKERLA
jgi:hypothetical protein